MKPSVKALCDKLTGKIQDSYEAGITLDEAEKLASEFLHAQLVISEEIRLSDLDARMKKSGVKAIKAAIYMEEATKTDKKPSDLFLQAKVDMHELTASEQKGLDEAEVLRDSLQSYFNIFKEAHIHFRGISKGRFE